jgi:hypothetical protein
MDTTHVVVATLLPLYWKFFLIGLFGNLLHVWKSSLTDKIPFFEYIKGDWQEIVWGLLCYQALIWVWHDWVLIGYISYLGIDFPKVPLNMGTIFIGYFSSSIMGAVLLLWEYLGAKLNKIFTKKIDSIGEPKP